MKKYLNHILALIIALSGLSSCSDKDEPSPIPEEPEVNGYCLMMYISGGDKEHDLIFAESIRPVSYTHLRAHETGRNLVCRLLLEKKKKETKKKIKNTYK